MSVTDLNHTARHICPVFYVFSNLLKDFYDHRLFNMSDQFFVRNVFSRCQWLKNYNNITLRYSMTIEQYFCIEESLKAQINGLNEQTVSAWQ